MSEPLFQAMCKATTAEGDQLKVGPNWIVARRGRLKLFEDHLACGDWQIPFADIQLAELNSVRSAFFYRGYVLKVETAERTYHFGLNGNRFWEGDLPFPVERKQASLRYSPVGILLRLLIAGYLIYALWERFS